MTRTKNPQIIRFMRHANVVNTNFQQFGLTDL